MCRPILPGLVFVEKITTPILSPTNSLQATTTVGKSHLDVLSDFQGLE